MPRSRRDIKTSVPDNSVLSLLDPLHALANAIGRAVAGQVVKEGRQKSETNKAIKVLDAKSMHTSVDALHAHVTAIAGMALAQLLIVPTAEARALRMSLILRLAREDLRIAKASSMEVRDPLHDRLLTTAEAASMLQTSRPHVSMLCKAGKLGEVVLTRRGRRRIQVSAIQAHLSNLVTPQEGGMSLRQAGIDAGLYDYPDWHFLNACRGEDAAAGARKAAPAKSARKDRR
ncbi:helix-turn-helix domain-containing protein [Variovorax sp. dw_308]|uniref:helix-turn-helix domain-containing protein n=1 Tax=Variovorax sp. dw_308 TaxID=2721546 RepID=UPI001C492B50|nr:helix-turn-helix domain-containing protein [Variovorax sp. dw_308]